MPSFTPKQLVLLVLLTIVWGLNWPVMKLGVQHFPPLSFRMVSMWIGLPILAIFVVSKGLPLTIPRSYWGQLAKLTLFNMVLWHCLIIIAIPTFISSLWGMNVPVPFADNPHGFFILGILATLITACAAYWLWKRKMF